jgi:peptide/nickel transport system permease protein
MRRSIPASATDLPAVVAATAEVSPPDARAPAGRRLTVFLLARKSTLAGLALFAVVTLAAAFAPVLSPYDPLEQDLNRVLLPPAWADGGSAAHPLGTDPLGRDLASRMLWGARLSLLISVASVLLGGGLGFIVGIVTGYFGGWLDAVLMRIGDIQLAFPFVLLAIAVLGVSPERTPAQLIGVLGLTTWIVYARVVRSRVLSEREKDYVRAARALGASSARVLLRYVLPNVWQVAPVIGMLYLGFFVIVESLLSFLALGLTPPTPSWGSILADGRQFMMVTPWMPIFPGLAILLTVLSINLVADGMADYFDPKLTKGYAPRHPLPPRMAIASDKVLAVRDLTTVFRLGAGVLTAVNRVSFELGSGQVLGIVGESGSGKSVLALSIIQLLDAPGAVTEGEIVFLGKDLARVSNAEMTGLRGRRIGMIFQNAGSSLNPVLTVGYQLVETLRQHLRLNSEAARTKAREALEMVGIGDPDRVLRAYPFQLSGGMQQRVMIALAMSVQPALLIADEPTTALDVTTQAQLLERLDELRRELGTSVIFITHDIALLADFADVVMVMYAGQVCEIGPRERVIREPRHPYTQGLLNSVSRVRAPGTNRLSAIPGDPPDPMHPSTGCPFAPRCAYAMAVCREVNPARTGVGPGHEAACHLLTSTPEAVAGGGTS